ncbi:hypothetical protein [Polaromonas glacialis]|uniref:hypothetical protein n=1 Tax=Polaromonas glacialis TaxID=866564 RepID=UPI000495383D|nr:hypothetical protein [Polaromonas glacialis]
MKALANYLRKEWREGKQFWLRDTWTPFGMLKLVVACCIAGFWGPLAGEWVSWIYHNTSHTVRLLLMGGGIVLCALYSMAAWDLLIVKPIRSIDQIAGLVALAFALLMGYWFGQTLDGREDRAAWLIFIEGTVFLWLLFFGPYALGATVLLDREPETASPLEPPADPS